MSTIKVDVVSAEESIFSGEATFVALPGEAGELGIMSGHTPLITRIKPGSVRIKLADGTEEFVFVAGGILEVQPKHLTKRVRKPLAAMSRRQSATPRAILTWRLRKLNLPC